MSSTRVRAWCFTSYVMDLFERNWEEEEEVKYLVMGKEICPTTGKEHLQGYVELTKKKCMKKVKAILHDPAVHLERRKGSQSEAIAYCKKDGKWKEWGKKDCQGRRNDFEAIKEKIKGGEKWVNIADEFFGDFVRYHKGLMLYKDLLDRERARERAGTTPEVIVYVGRAGAGKSYHCFNDPDYQSSGYLFMCQQQGKVFFDGYEGQSTIWFDEFNGSVLPFQLWCRVCDAYTVRVETKGGSVIISGLKKVLISTTTLPQHWWRCDKYLEDPNQLWRRLTKVYYIPKPRNGLYCEPILIREPEHLTDNLCNEYERAI